MSDKRIDPDYNPTDSEIETFAKLWAIMDRRIGSVNYIAPRNGNGGWRDWLLAVSSVLAASGICGLIVMYGDQSSQKTAISDLREEVHELRTDLKELNGILRNRP